MRPISVLILAAALAPACAFLEEQRTTPTEISWAGWVLVDRPSADTTDVLSDGTVEFLDLDGQLIADATQPYDGSPGYWEVIVPVDTEVAVRVAGSAEADPPLTTMVWRGTSPSGQGLWLDGALLTRELSYFDDFFALLADIPGLDPQSLADGEVAHLWGEPIDPEAWAGATIDVTDGEGQPAELVVFEIDESGSLLESDGGRVDLFIAINLPEGSTTLDVTTASGATVTTEWPTRKGELLSAIYYALPEE